MIAIPLAIILSGIVRGTAERQAIQDVLKEQIATQRGELVGIEHLAGKSGVIVVATMRSAHPLDQATVDAISTTLSMRLKRPVILEVVVLPAMRSASFPTP